MLLSRNLLNKLNPKFQTLSDLELTEGLNAIGVEVEEILKHQTNPGLRVARLLSASKHPDSDHLNVCEVLFNDGEKKQIVCGAPNLPIGFKVIVAPVGYVFSNGIEIKKRNIRGIESNGMMCGYNELTTLFNDVIDRQEIDGLVRIDPNTNLSDEEIYDFLGLSDTIFDLSLPSNRNELNGVYYLAYELNAYFDFKTPLLISSQFEVKNSDLNIEIHTDKVYEYGLLEINLNSIYDYTRWDLKRLLVNSNIHITNTFADYANYLTLLYANPVHLFKKELVKKNLVIKELKEDTKFIGLDDKEYLLKKGTLVTCSDNHIVAAIGLMGSKEFAIENKDIAFYLEVVNLNTDYFRKLVSQNNISSISANLFSKPLAKAVSSLSYTQVINDSFFSALSHKINPLRIIDCEKNKLIQVSNQEINSLLGIQLSNQQIDKILNLTGFKRINEFIMVPNYRLDIFNTADICEEILKSIDINKFVAEPIIAPVLDFNKNAFYEALLKIRQYLVIHQFIETKTYNLTSKEKFDRFNWFNLTDSIQVLNPLSNQRVYLRHNLIVQLLEVLEYNLNHKQLLSNLFEIQKIQIDHHKAFTNLTLLWVRNNFKNVINHNEVINDIHNLKSLVQGLMSYLNKQIKFEYETKDLDGLKKETSFVIKDKNDNLIGYAGTLKNTVLKEYKLSNQNVVCLSLNLDVLLKPEIKTIQHIQAISDVNPIYKDFSFKNPEHRNLEVIFESLKEITEVKEVTLVDTYEKENQLTFTISTKIESNKTLTSEEIQTIIDQIILVLNKNGISLN